MKKTSPLSPLLLIGSQVLATCALAQHPNTLPDHFYSYGGFQLPTDFNLPAEEIHPSLWFSANELDALRNKRNGDDYSRKLWEKVSRSPFLTMDIPSAPTKEAGKNPVHQYYGTVSQIAAYSGAMHQLETEESKKREWAARAAKALRVFFEGPLYDYDPVNVKGTPVDEIYHAVWAQNLAAAYDWIQPALSEEEDQEIRDLLAKEADYIFNDLWDYAADPHNHMSKPAWGLGSLALAMPTHPRAKQWLDRAVQGSNLNTAYYFSKDGIYREGSHYLMFSFLNYFPFLNHFTNVTGINGFEYFQPAAEYPLVARNGKGWLPNIEDAFIRPFPTHLLAPHYKDAKSGLHTEAPLSEILQWSYFHTDMTPFEHIEQKTGFNYSGATWDYPMPLIEFLGYDPGIKQTVPNVSPTIFLEGGQSFFRNSWAFNSDETLYLLFQGVAEAENHKHADHLSFIIQAKNQMMASDQGYTRESYGENVRTSWYNQAKAHNVVMVNGKAPADKKVGSTPPSRHRIDSRWFDFEEKEAYYEGGTHRRAIAFPMEAYFAVVDEVELDQESDITVNLFGGRGYTTDGPNKRTWIYSEDAYGPSAKMTAWFIGKGLRIEDQLGELTYLKGDWGRFPYATASARGRSKPMLQLIFPLDIDEDGPGVTDLSDDQRSVARIDFSNGVSDLFMVQLQGQRVRIGPIETDATFLWARIDANGAISHVSLRKAQSLRIEGNEVLRAESPITLTGRVANRSVEIATAEGETGAFEISLQAIGIQASIIVNGSDQSVQSNSAWTKVRF